MNSTPPPERGRSKSRRTKGLRMAGMILFGAALLLLVMSLTILREETANPHASPTSIVPLSTSGVVDAPSKSTSMAPPKTEPQLSAFEQAQAAGAFLSGSAAVDELRIYEDVSPDAGLMLTFPREGMKQISSTFLIIAEQEDAAGLTWYRIRLPIRPNGSTGWVRGADLTIATVSYEMRIDLSDHRLDLYELGRLKKSYPIGVGTDENPTPPGKYYITIKLKPTKPNSVYGVLAMGVSGFSEKLTDWPDGGQLGIHGTNDPSSIGRDVSYGCIRLQNEDILDLSQYVAYGTPVLVEQ